MNKFIKEELIGTLKSIAFWIGIILIVAASLWNVFIYIQNFDNLLTPMDKFILYWRPCLVFLAGYILFKSSNQ